MTVVVSNRGPYRFVAQPDGGFDARPGAGGVASALGPLLTAGAAGPGAAWIAAAIGDDDRAAVRAGALPDTDIALTYYDVVSNGILWFLHHGLFDLPRRPRFDHHFREAWDAYVSVSRSFADAAAKAAGERDIVLVQDYQLALVPGMLANARPDLRIVHFTHTAFCGPNSIRVLPTATSTALLSSMASVPCGFHADRWARSYEASARTILGSSRDLAPTFVAPLGPNADELTEIAATAECAAAGRELDELLGGRKMLLRVDRVEPSKNIVRGFSAYDLLLEHHPEWRSEVVFVVRGNPSRESLPEYLGYRNEIEQAVARVNDRWGTDDWQPVVLDTSDDFARTIAAFARYDALLVNPIKDGLNLVAKEGPILNQGDGVLCLSPDAGAWDELHEAAIETHPYDLEQAAQALHTALSMPADERAARATRLRELASARTPKDWLADQLAAAH